MNKTIFKIFSLMLLFTSLLFARGGYLAESYVEDGIKWQNLHEHIGYRSLLIAFPDPVSIKYRLGGEALSCRTTYNNVSFQMYASQGRGSASAENWIRAYEACYAGKVLVPVNETKEDAHFIVEIYGENYIQRHIEYPDIRVRLTVEGEDLSLAPLFFDKFSACR